MQMKSLSAWELKRTSVRITESYYLMLNKTIINNRLSKIAYSVQIFSESQ